MSNDIDEMVNPTLILPEPVARESPEFKAWCEEHCDEFQEHMRFATQAWRVMRREPPSPQYEILAAAVIAAMRVRDHKRGG